MNNIVITSESPIDLSPEQAKKYSVEIIPLHIIINNKDYLDGVDINPDKIYEIFDREKILPKTSAISVAEYESFFEKFTGEGKSVIHFSLSSKISSTCFNAKKASEKFKNVYVFDSKKLSSGMALQVIKAVEMTRNNSSVSEIINAAEINRDKVSTSFVLDSLSYISKSGRCSSATALGANILGIKPVIENAENGTLFVSKKYRGKIDNVRFEYVKNKLNEKNIDKERLFLTHSGTDEKSILKIKNFIEQNYDFKEIIVCRAGCTISSHCGPETMGVLFMKK